MIFRYCRNFRRTFFSRAADGPLGGETDFPLFPLVRYPLLEFSLGVPVLSPQVGPKPCRTVFRPFMTVFDRLFGADRPRNSRRIKHSSVFRPLAHRLKTVKTVKTVPHQSGLRRESTKTHPALASHPVEVGLVQDGVAQDADRGAVDHDASDVDGARPLALGLCIGLFE